VTLLRQLRVSARRRVAFHLNSRRRAEQGRGFDARRPEPTHEDVMSPKGAHFIAAKG